MPDRSCGADVPFLLAELAVDTVFGMPGVHSLEFYRSLEAAGITHVSVRHEQGAGFMADGYARASGRPGVALLISGPGVTNAATALGQAWSDSIPVLLISAAVARDDLGMGAGALHEIQDQRGVTVPITALSAIAHTPQQIPELLRRAHALFCASRPRPAHISIPVDVLAAPAVDSRRLPAAPHRPGPDPAGIEQLAKLLRGARTSVVLAGGGAAGAAREIAALVEATDALFVSTIAGKGILPDDHPNTVGSSLQRPATRRMLAQADVVLAIGTEIAEPDLYVTADAEAADALAPEIAQPRLHLTGKFARIDIDPDVLLRTRAPEVALLSDARLAVRALLEAVTPRQGAISAHAVAARVRAQNENALSPLEQVHHAVLGAVRQSLPQDALVYADMCQIAYTGCITFPVQHPGRWHFPMGFGTLGYALPAAIGGKLARPDLAVAALMGDGGLQFTLQELATAAELKLSLPILLWDNDALGEIADFMRARQIPQVGVRPFNPDFAALAKAYGLGYELPSSCDDIADAVAGALTADVPVLIHLKQDRFGP